MHYLLSISTLLKSLSLCVSISISATPVHLHSPLIATLSVQDFLSDRGSSVSETGEHSSAQASNKDRILLPPPFQVDNQGLCAAGARLDPRAGPPSLLQSLPRWKHWEYHE